MKLDPRDQSGIVSSQPDAFEQPSCGCDEQGRRQAAAGDANERTPDFWRHP